MNFSLGNTSASGCGSFPDSLCVWSNWNFAMHNVITVTDTAESPSCLPQSNMISSYWYSLWSISQEQLQCSSKRCKPNRNLVPQQWLLNCTRKFVTLQLLLLRLQLHCIPFVSYYNCNCCYIHLTAAQVNTWNSWCTVGCPWTVCPTPIQRELCVQVNRFSHTALPDRRRGLHDHTDQWSNPRSQSRCVGWSHDERILSSLPDITIWILKDTQWCSLCDSSRISEDAKGCK